MKLPRAASPIRMRGLDADAIAAVKKLLSDAVALQSIADVPLGAFLSGGIDSSTIVALMQAQSTRPVKTFTIGFREARYEEAQHAKAVAHHLGTDHTELYVTAPEVMAVIPKLPALYDEPFGDSSAIPTYLLCELARRQVTVSLSGDGGDELFGGYRRYQRTANLWHAMRRVPYFVRNALARGAKAFSRGFAGTAMGLKSGRLALYLSARTAEDCYRIELLQNLASHDLILPRSGDALRANIGWDSNLCSRHLYDAMMYADAAGYLPDDILVKVDRASMGVSLETRIPMLDHRVVEFAWSLPVHLKVLHGEGKWLLKQILRKYVPTALTERPKMGFGVPVGQWIRGPLRGWAEELLSPDRLRDGPLDGPSVRGQWMRHLKGIAAAVMPFGTCSCSRRGCRRSALHPDACEPASTSGPTLSARYRRTACRRHRASNAVPRRLDVLQRRLYRRRRLLRRIGVPDHLADIGRTCGGQIQFRGILATPSPTYPPGARRRGALYPGGRLVPLLSDRLSGSRPQRAYAGFLFLEYLLLAEVGLLRGAVRNQAAAAYLVTFGGGAVLSADPSDAVLADEIRSPVAQLDCLHPARQFVSGQCLVELVYPDAAFYLPHTRAWELLIGSLLALTVSNRTQPAPRARWISESLSVAGLLAIVGAAVFYDRATAFPGVAALAPCMGAAAVIWSNTGAMTFTGRILAHRVPVWIGLISYSLYLWHWPLLAFARYSSPLPLSTLTATCIVFGTTAIAWLSYRYVETPVREWPVFRRRLWVIPSAATVLLAMFLAGMYVNATGGVRGRKDFQAATFEADISSPDRRKRLCEPVTSVAMRYDFICVVEADNSGSKLLLVGDSFAEMYLQPLPFYRSATNGRCGM